MKITNKTVQEAVKHLQEKGIEINLHFEGYPARAIFVLDSLETTPMKAPEALMFLSGFDAGYKSAMKVVNG